jgi:hypothetical protein
MMDWRRRGREVSIVASPLPSLLALRDVRSLLMCPYVRCWLLSHRRSLCPFDFSLVSSMPRYHGYHCFNPPNISPGSLSYSNDSLSCYRYNGVKSNHGIWSLLIDQRIEVADYAHPNPTPRVLVSFYSPPRVAEILSKPTDTRRWWWSNKGGHLLEG